MSASGTKDFHIGDVLSITTGRLVSPRHIEGVYDILGWMSGESMFTHQLGRVAKEAAPVILAAHPRLAEIVVPELGPDTFQAWLDEQIAIYGEMLPIPRMTADQHESIDALSELAEMVPRTCRSSGAG